jgi:hypothetical protein
MSHDRPVPRGPNPRNASSDRVDYAMTQAEWFKQNAIDLYDQGTEASHRKGIKSMKRACHLFKLASMWEEAALCSDTWKTWKAHLS